MRGATTKQSATHTVIARRNDEAISNAYRHCEEERRSNLSTEMNCFVPLNDGKGKLTTTEKPTTAPSLRGGTTKQSQYRNGLLRTSQ
ncbi:MAG: hypothetical protein LBR81_02920 [Prevotellaceae bacterium]|nr:hypothetical protein [Prevotellaceae bacterium]